MDPASRLLRIHALFYGPGPDFVFTGGQKRYQPEQVIRNADQLVERRFGNAEVVKKDLRLAYAAYQKAIAQGPGAARVLLGRSIMKVDVFVFNTMVLIGSMFALLGLLHWILRRQLEVRRT